MQVLWEECYVYFESKEITTKKRYFLHLTPSTYKAQFEQPSPPKPFNKNDPKRYENDYQKLMSTPEDDDEMMSSTKKQRNQSAAKKTKETKD